MRYTVKTLIKLNNGITLNCVNFIEAENAKMASMKAYEILKGTCPGHIVLKGITSLSKFQK